jgi:hypothetical protein
MCDSTAAYRYVLSEAKETIDSTDPSTKGVWMTNLNSIPNQDMQFTMRQPFSGGGIPGVKASPPRSGGPLSTTITSVNVSSPLQTILL